MRCLHLPKWSLITEHQGHRLPPRCSAQMGPPVHGEQGHLRPRTPTNNTSTSQSSLHSVKYVSKAPIRYYKPQQAPPSHRDKPHPLPHCCSHTTPHTTQGLDASKGPQCSCIDAGEARLAYIDALCDACICRSSSWAQNIKGTDCHLAAVLRWALPYTVN